MIDPFKEAMLSFGQAARQVPGRPVSTQTIHRWHDKGIAGVKLEAIVIGGRLHSSKEALTRFFAAVTQAKQAAQQTDGAASERSEATSRKLAEAGLI